MAVADRSAAPQSLEFVLLGHRCCHMELFSWLLPTLPGQDHVGALVLSRLLCTTVVYCGLLWCAVDRRCCWQLRRGKAVTEAALRLPGARV